MLYDVLRRVKNEVNIMMWLTIILALVIVSGVYTYARYTYHTEVTGVTVTVPGIGYCAYNEMTLADCVLVTDADDEPYETVSIAKTVIEAKTQVTSFSELSTTDEGLYDAEDDYGTSYYFRGAVEDNYVSFAGYTWRIVRINGDGSVRIVLDDYLDIVNFNNGGDSVKYVGYTYGNDDSTLDAIRQNDNDSTIKQYLDGWYEENLIDYEEYISDTLFCNDRSIDSDYYTWSDFENNNGFFAAIHPRMYDTYSPTLICESQLDRFTVEDTETGNGYLTYPIALLTVDEVSMAGAVYYGGANTSYYLYNEAGWFWTMTPAWLNNGIPGMFTVNNPNNSDSINSGYTYRSSTAARPVINLSSNVYVYSGTGTQDDPYEVSLTKRNIYVSGDTCDGNELSCVMLLNSTGKRTVEEAVTAIENKDDPDFSDTSPGDCSITGYTDNLPSLINSLSSSSYKLSTSRYITYASSYTFDEETGTYSLVNPSVGVYSSIYSSLPGKYIVSYWGSTSSGVASYTSRSTIYYVTSSTSSSTIYFISSTVNTDVSCDDYSETGLYASEDDYGTSYYYRGAVTDNYVYFAGYTWRIVRRNGDGSIRLIMQDIIGTVSYNENYNSPKYVGYTYGNDDSTQSAARQNDNDSAIKKYMDSWYSTNIEETKYESYLSDVLYCNDRTLASDYTWDELLENSYGYFSVLERLYAPYYNNSGPTLKCSNQLDRFTVDDTKTGNGYLTYPIALLTIDEISMAGGLLSSEYGAYYLNNMTSWWTMTPSDFYYGTSGVWDESSGNLKNSNSVTDVLGVRPVINISSSVLVASGTGTASAPYILTLE